MKLRNIFIAIVAVAMAAVGCQKELTQYSEVNVDKSLICISDQGGSDKTVLHTTGDWVLEAKWNEDDGQWVTISKTSGAACPQGEEIVFTAEPSSSYREVEVYVTCNGKSQIIKVTQGVNVASEATVKEILEEGVNGKTYMVTGTVVEIKDASYYGNWYMKDSSTDERLYIFGTLTDSGEYDFPSFNIEVGDVVTVKGPRTVYGDVIELEDVSVLDVKKSLVGAEKMSHEVSAEGGKLDVVIGCKGTTLTQKSSVDWITFEDVKIGGNKYQDSTIFVFNVAPFQEIALPRTGTIEFVSTKQNDKDKSKTDESRITITVVQNGLPPVFNEGAYWMIVNVDGVFKSFAPLPADEGYGNPPAVECTETSALGANAMFFREVEGGWTIQDMSGRYYYQKGTYSNFNVSATVPESGYIWTLAQSPDQTWVIQNATVKKWIQYDTGYGNFGSYDNQKGICPTLVPAIAQPIANGTYWMMAGENTIVSPTLKNDGYGYMLPEDAVNGKGTAANAFTFTFVEGKGYTIQNASGEYYYMQGTYNNFNKSETAPESGHYWTLFPNLDGTYVITNIEKNKWIQYSTKYSSAGSYAEEQTEAVLPKLVSTASN